MFELRLLDFPKILDIIKGYAILDSVKEELDNLLPSNNKKEVEIHLKETDEAKVCLERLGSPMISYFSFDEINERIRIGAPINAKEFIEVLKLIDNAQRLRTYFKKAESIEIDTIKLREIYNPLSPLLDLKNEILKTIDNEGNILDNASPELYKIRKQIRLLDQRITEKYNQIIKTEASKLSESLITLRNGHRVIPVKAEFKNQIKGVVFDESQSGATIYIEPYACFEIENQIGLIRQEEAKEIDKILYALSNTVFSFQEDINNNYEIIKHLDFIFSKAMYAKYLNATLPLISDDVDLIDARHPLIDPEKVIPNTISLKKNTSMIITGPNTGGKTVVLKTLGLLLVMAQSGLLLPVKEGSTIPIFKGIYADIGDEQSIEQSLSTFSSHMGRIVNILNNVESESLVLLDELGSGTDPKEGASLAISIIDFLRNQNLYLLATTHYPELKAYAYNNKDTVNASVEFDVDTLKPTYKLLIGVPGKSNAFLISKRLGLNSEIIKNAEEVSLEFSSETSTLIEKLGDEANSLNLEKEKYSKLIDELNLKIKEATQSNAEIKQKYQKKLDELSTERNAILEKTQRSATKLLDDIKEIKRDLEDKKPVKDDKIAALKGEVNSLYQDKLYVKAKNNREIKEGDNVKVLPFDKVGVVTKISKDKYNVSMGSINSIFKKEDLEIVDKAPDNKGSVSKIKPNLNLDTKATLDLRGMRYEEALDKLDSFVDSATLSNLEVVTVIHGFGTLALRNMVISYAKTHDIVKKYRPGEETEGGNGVTILYLK